MLHIVQSCIPQVPYSTCAENCSITNVHVAYPTCLFCFIMAVPSFFRDRKCRGNLASITPNLLCRLFYTVQFFFLILCAGCVFYLFHLHSVLIFFLFFFFSLVLYLVLSIRFDRLFLCVINFK